jgi:hypothetical protein
MSVVVTKENRINVLSYPDFELIRSFKTGIFTKIVVHGRLVLIADRTGGIMVMNTDGSIVFQKQFTFIIMNLWMTDDGNIAVHCYSYSKHRLVVLSMIGDTLSSFEFPCTSTVFISLSPSGVYAVIRTHDSILVHSIREEKTVRELKSYTIGGMCSRARMSQNDDRLYYCSNEGRLCTVSLVDENTVFVQGFNEIVDVSRDGRVIAKSLIGAYYVLNGATLETLSGPHPMCGFTSNCGLITYENNEFCLPDGRAVVSPDTVGITSFTVSHETFVVLL